jgi:hypothetical protein
MHEAALLQEVSPHDYLYPVHTPVFSSFHCGRILWARKDHSHNTIHNGLPVRFTYSDSQCTFTLEMSGHITVTVKYKTQHNN